MTFFYISIHYFAMLTVIESGYYKYIERRLHKRLAEKTDIQTIILEKRKGCCRFNCLVTAEAATIADCRRKMWAKSEKERVDSICKSIKHATGQTSKRPFDVQGIATCKKAWCTAYGISETSYLKSVVYLALCIDQFKTSTFPTRAAPRYVNF